MAPETKQVITDALNEELRAAGLGTFDDLEDRIRNVATSEPEERMVVGMLLGLRHRIEVEPEPSPEELREMLAKTKGNLRYQFRSLVSKAAKQFIKPLPRKPGTGRKRGLTEEQERRACDRVAALIRKKTPYKAALLRVGQEFGVGPRTIQRAWQRRPEDAE